MGVSNAYIGSSGQLAAAVVLNAKLGADLAFTGTYFIPLAYTDEVGAGTWASVVDLTQFTVVNTHNSGSATNLDNYTIYVNLPSGTYTLRYIHATGATMGICKIYIDGTLVMTTDQYSGGDVHNVSAVQAGIVVASNSKKAVMIKVDGKNAGSAGYLLVTTAIIFTRTG